MLKYLEAGRIFKSQGYGMHIHRKISIGSNYQARVARERGAATLVMSLVLMMLSTIIVIFAANYSQMQSKSVANMQRQQQAFEAARAGMEYGINYLENNSSNIFNNPVNGFIRPYTDSNITNVTLANNSRFTVTYSNPVAYNYNLISISCTGTSDDGSASKTVSQLVEEGSLLLNIPTRPIIAKGAITLSESAQIFNLIAARTLQTGSTISINNSAFTFTPSGVSSTSGGLGADVEQNNSTLSGISSGDLFASYFGLSPTMVANNSSTRLSNNSDTDYSSQLNGLRGTTIWINQTAGTASIKGSATIGSSSNPVLLIISGNTNISESAVIYGMVYVDNPLAVQVSGSAMIIGGIVATGALNVLGSGRVIYSSFVLNNLQNLNTLRYYSKVPGSWKDF